MLLLTVNTSSTVTSLIHTPVSLHWGERSGMFHVDLPGPLWCLHAQSTLLQLGWPSFPVPSHPPLVQPLHKLCLPLKKNKKTHIIWQVNKTQRQTTKCISIQDDHIVLYVILSNIILLPWVIFEVYLDLEINRLENTLLLFIYIFGTCRKSSVTLHQVIPSPRPTSHSNLFLQHSRFSSTSFSISYQI